jgi:hypothetical protein
MVRGGREGYLLVCLSLVRARGPQTATWGREQGHVRSSRFRLRAQDLCLTPAAAE